METRALNRFNRLSPEDKNLYLRWADANTPEDHWLALAAGEWRTTAQAPAPVTHIPPAPADILTEGLSSDIPTPAPALQPKKQSTPIPKPPAPSWFDTFWRVYPANNFSPKDQTKALFDQDIKTEEDFRNLMSAVGVYKKRVGDSTMTFAAIKFLRQWRDYAEAGSEASRGYTALPGYDIAIPTHIYETVYAPATEAERERYLFDTYGIGDIEAECRQTRREVMALAEGEPELAAWLKKYVPAEDQK